MIPHRVALSGGWIDQPFVSSLNPEPPGSMVTVQIEPDIYLMERCGFASGTRKVAMELWGGRVPERRREELVRELYRAENQGRAEPSGSQDMIGLIYAGVCRLDYDAAHEGGYFPRHIEQTLDAGVARWFERVFHMIPVAPRPAGYNPLGVKRLERDWIRRLGQSGKDCYAAIVGCDARALGAAMNETMACWEAILPQVVEHETIKLDLRALLRRYQERYEGAMYSGCGGGYLFVVSERAVEGALKVRVRLA